MTDIWTSVCPTCGGSGQACWTLGGICAADKSGPWSEWCINKCPKYKKTKPCPTCTDGKVRLEVECEDCEGQGAIMAIRRGHFVTQDMAMDCDMPEIAGAYMGDEPEPEPCGVCETTGYRPMTKQEVEELVEAWDKVVNDARRLTDRNITMNGQELMIDSLINEKIVTYKGQRVRVGK